MMPNDFNDIEESHYFRMNVIFSLSDFIERHGTGIFDIANLEFRKEVILYAYLTEVATNPSIDEVEVFAAGATLLASFQPNVGRRGYSSDEIQKLLSAPLFQEGALSKADKAVMTKQMDFVKVFQASLKERQKILERVEEAKFLNTNIQNISERLKRRTWKIVRPIIYRTGVILFIILCLPLLILPDQYGKKIADIPMKLINRISDAPRYEWGKPSFKLD